MKTRLAGAGASFPAPLYKKWFESFSREHPEIRISYKAVGSETGTHQLADKKLDFAASDVPLLAVSPSPDGAHFQSIPVVLGAVVPVYNLKSVNQDLKFTPEALADIYLGTILDQENLLGVTRYDHIGSPFLSTISTERNPPNTGCRFVAGDRELIVKCPLTQI